MQGFLMGSRPWHNPAMADEPIMTPKAGGFFSEWSVEVVWSSGHKDKVTGFRDEAHARGWIAHEVQGLDRANAGAAAVLEARAPIRP